jgi:hypothetical protein
MTTHVRDATAIRELLEIHVRDATAIRQVKEGWVRDATGLRQFYAAETITLSGTAGTPNNDNAVVIDPGTATAGWRFETDGEVFRVTGPQFQAGIEWTDLQPTPGKDYWIRATANSGSVPNAGSDSLGVWHKVAGSGSGNRTWQWQRTTVGIYQGSVKVEIATDSGGTDIVATGYYGGIAEIEI